MTKSTRPPTRAPRGRAAPSTRRAGTSGAPRVVRNRQRAEPVGRRQPIAPAILRAPFFIILGIVTCLSLFGLVMVLSASSVTSLTANGSPWSEFVSQAMWLGLGMVALLIGAVVDYRRWRHITLAALVVSVVMLVGVLVPGLGVSWQGAQRWIRLGPVQFQPSEIAKLTLVLYAAHVLARSKVVDTRKSVRPILTILIVFGTLILLQPNLGTTIIVFAIGLAVLYASGARTQVILGIGAASVLGASLLAYLAEYRRARLLAFLDPWADPLDDGWQTIQSLVSVANGGVTGVGIGASRGKFGFLPEAHNDFVFAVTAEEFGLVGAVGVVAAYVLLGMTALFVARRADRFGALLVVGIATWILVQAFINMGAVVGIMPITGVPLPFMSAGGTSLITTMAGVGIMLNVARSIR